MLTKVVATDSGNSVAIMANVAVRVPAEPSASTTRTANDSAINAAWVLTRSNTLSNN